ncbi:MAG: hypothetical protein NTY77_05485 [Elusimicrobia bacterium]|nr:hypothetical protein [Elusimicrobiota bacterium]
MNIKREIWLLANKHGYRMEQHQENIFLLIFVKPGVQINVYYSTMTVGTAINHPKQGKTQLFRRGCSLQDLAAIFKNPRAHLGTGYHELTELERRGG